MARERSTASPLALPEAVQTRAMVRFAVLRPHLEDDVPLTRAAEKAGAPLRTVQRWLARYRQLGLSGLARHPRRDAGKRAWSCRLLNEEARRSRAGLR